MKVVIPEGYTRRADRRARARRRPARATTWPSPTRARRLLDHPPTARRRTAGTPNLEGFLFPATYDLYAGANVRELVAEQLMAFRAELRPRRGRARRARRTLTPYQLLIVASMVEREAAHRRATGRSSPPSIYNRLRLACRSGIDATLRYALNDFTAPLTERSCTTRSPYNTRLHKGLPPTPIGNPGLASIRRRRAPRARPYLYYVAGADGCGEHVFSTTYASSNAPPPPTARRCARTAARPDLQEGQARCSTPAQIGHAAWQGGLVQGSGPRLAGRAQPLAGDAQRPPSPRAAWTTGATSACRCRRSCSRRRCARSARRGFLGANVTIPHKEAALALADEASDAARAIGAANTLTFAPDGAVARREHRRPGHHRGAGALAGMPGPSALVLGAGGSARAAVWALLERRRARGVGVEPHSASARSRWRRSSGLAR